MVATIRWEIPCGRLPCRPPFAIPSSHVENPPWVSWGKIEIRACRHQGGRKLSLCLLGFETYIPGGAWLTDPDSALAPSLLLPFPGEGPPTLPAQRPIICMPQPLVLSASKTPTMICIADVEVRGYFRLLRCLVTVDSPQVTALGAMWEAAVPW